MARAALKSRTDEGDRIRVLAALEGSKAAYLSMTLRTKVKAMQTLPRTKKGP